MMRLLVVVLIVALAAGLWWQLSGPHLPAAHKPGVARLTPEPAPALQAVAPPPAPVAPAPEPQPEPEPAPPVPLLKAGKMVTVVLSEPPALQYGQAAMSDTDQHYRDLVAEVAGGTASYDPNLGRAARELVYQTTEFGDVVPGDVREFAIAAAGAVAADATFQQIRTNAEGDASLKQAITAVVRDHSSHDGPLRVGVGEVYRQGLKLPRHIGVVGTRVGMDVQPLPIKIKIGATWPIRGRLRAAWTEIQALVLDGNGDQQELPVAVSGDAVTFDIVAAVPGALDVQFVGKGPSGPGKIVQLRAWVDREPPDRITAQVPADESALDLGAAEGYALQLLNADRVKFKREPLQWDSQLADIARSHSRDMRDHGFFGHQSPTTGLPGDRIKAAGYLQAGYAENVALNGTLFEAEEGLMHSLGHRRNILEPTMTHVGIGVATTGAGKGRRFWITQLFAKPALNLSPEAAEAVVATAIHKARQARGMVDLELDGPLSEAARFGAEKASRDGFEGAARMALDEAKRRELFSGSLGAHAAMTSDPEHAETPDAALQPEAKKFAVGAARANGEAQFVVVILVLK